MHVVENIEYYVIYKTYYLFNLVGGYTARLLVPGVLLQLALFLILNTLFKLLSMPKSAYCIYFTGTVHVSVITHIYYISSTQWRVEVCEDKSVFESSV